MGKEYVGRQVRVTIAFCDTITVDVTIARKADDSDDDVLAFAMVDALLAIDRHLNHLPAVLAQVVEGVIEQDRTTDLAAEQDALHNAAVVLHQKHREWLESGKQ